MKSIAAFIVCLSLLGAAVAQSSTPKSSGTPGQGSTRQPPAHTPGTTADNYSGMYTFLQEGEFVQISVEGEGQVTGFISRYGELPSDKGAFLDQFFKRGALQGQKLTFETEPVHGVWYEFRGTIGRGDGKTPNDEGYYAAKGTLVQHTSDAEKKTSAKSREVIFKSFPQDAGAEPPHRD